MSGIDSLIEQQYRSERKFRGFLSSLDSSRIVTLRKLVLEPKMALDRLNAQWLDHSRFVTRLNSMCEFLNDVADHERIPGYSKMGLIFFQRTDPEGDKKAFAQRFKQFKKY